MIGESVCEVAQCLASLLSSLFSTYRVTTQTIHHRHHIVHINMHLYATYLLEAQLNKVNAVPHLGTR